MVSAIICSLGSTDWSRVSTRLLEVVQKPALQHMIDQLHLAQVLDVVLVIPQGDAGFQESLKSFNLKVAMSENGHIDPLSAVLLGMRTIAEKDFHGVIVCPIEYPFISQALVVDLLQAYWKSHKNIIIPLHDGKRGYPIILGSDRFLDLHAVNSLHELIDSHQDDVMEVAMEESAAGRDIDAPAVVDLK